MERSNNSAIQALVSDSAIYGLGNAVNRFLYVFLVPVYTAVFTPADYGIVDVLTITISLLLPIALMGMDSAVARYYYDTKDQEERSRIVTTGLVFVALWGLLMFAVLAWALPMVLPGFVSPTLTRWICLTLAVIVPVQATATYLMNMLRWALLKWRYLLMATVLVIAQAGLSVAFVVGAHLGVRGVFLAILCAYVLSTALGVILTRHMLRPRVSLVLLRRLLVFGYPFVITALSGIAMASFGRYFLVRYGTLTEVGWFALARQLASALNFLIAGFVIAWGPFAFSIHERVDAQAVYRRVLRYYSTVVFSLAIVLGLFAREIIAVVSRASYLGAAQAVGPLAIDVSLSGSVYIFALGVTLAKRTHLLTWTSIGGLLAGMVLNWLLVPRYGVVGAATAAMCATATLVASVYAASQSQYRIPFGMRSFCVWVAIAVSMTLVTGVIDALAWPIRPGAKLLALLVCCVVVLAFRLITKDEILGAFHLLATTVSRMRRHVEARALRRKAQRSGAQL